MGVSNEQVCQKIGWIGGGRCGNVRACRPTRDGLDQDWAGLEQQVNQENRRSAKNLESTQGDLGAANWQMDDFGQFDCISITFTDHVMVEVWQDLAGSTGVRTGRVQNRLNLR
ncbi:hypothetical protein CROQUDRAFT_94140 [Cronartium quercuum f. sp. fusiforme G11]|uniref:Uncharacterized protein n=1 Tax=Cronartium quercuum f. sp. fusiforme G11 TaxID=708437 RepID=A0A9P6TB08_9BASI|nr:hypothetical protein CROQUDRAFT_94140 [Cronartium quercuum f. sp. fusiforme G11]